MKTGTSVQSLAQRIIDESGTKKDYAIDTRSLDFAVDIKDEKPQAGLQFNVNGEARQVIPTSHCLTQIGSHVGIPAKYFDRMLSNAPELLATNVNHWFKNEPQLRMLRTLQNGHSIGRAFLSKKYRPLDNYDLMNCVLPTLNDHNVEIISAELTDTRLYIQAVTNKIQGEVTKGDVVQAGILISNSEVGSGSIRVEPLIYRLVCTNGMIRNTAMKRHHVGRSGDGAWDSGEAFELYSDKTRELDDRAFWSKVTDVVEAAFDELQFADEVKTLTQAVGIDTGSPTEAVEIIGKKYDLFEKERESVLTHLAKGGDLSLWGLANAVTRAAEDCESYDRAIDLERIGGHVVELPQSIFKVK